jgi:uncharacterized damage-inducible protein DinB
MDAKTYFLKQIAGTYDLLDSALEGLTAEQLPWIPPGTANPIGLTIVHALSSEDMFISILCGKSQVWQTQGWAEKFNLSEPPGYGQDWTVYRNAKLTVESLLAYREAVRLKTKAYLDTLTSEGLDRSIEIFGETSLVADVLVLCCNHLLEHTGEIAALKGVYGAKGLPF